MYTGSLVSIKGTSAYIVCPLSTIFKDFQYCLADQSQIACGASKSRWNKSLLQVPESHGQVSESHGEVSESNGQVSESNGQVSESHGQVSESHGLMGI